ncbi:alpha/beta hydrolase [Galbitalea soli]|uniref:Alpha/beta fold hydrolase n=1 Tax=Galbitalea soli TaxID=1268042 RepID=A0A7C9PP74_9MICO|nr:alpha/beta fold hydrolase [Galbitalea soli]NEM92087.1 alpha/beta fold hydrolase [Galbitalea soli]NYJ31961.1 phospholipase/carboxylesterase [Galbitalea soli]
MKLDSEAVIWSAPERERAGRPLLVLLHGYGSHEGDLFSLAPHLPLGPVVASLRAPVAESAGWAWFSLRGSEPGNPEQGRVDAAAQAVLDWLDEQHYASVALLGFSQGAAIALQLMRLAPERFAAVVALSGFVEGGRHSGDEALLAQGIPVFWGRGTEDRVITAAAIARTEEWLPAHADATVRIYENLAHGISAGELGEVNGFLRAALA